MDEKQKIFIRGCRGHGKEIHGILTGLGAIDAHGMRCENEDAIYYINHKNKISCAYTNSEVALTIMDNYKEIKLPEKQLKNDNIYNINENLNLVELLKFAPVKTKLWSSKYGKCELMKVIDDDDVHSIGSKDYPIVCTAKNGDNDIIYVTFTKNGTDNISDPNSKCILFPSKQNRDWSKVDVSKLHKHFKPYQKVLVRSLYSDGSTKWIPGLYGYYDIEEKLHWILGVGFVNNFRIVSYNNNRDKLINDK